MASITASQQQKDQAETEFAIITIADDLGLVTDEEFDEAVRVLTATMSQGDANPFLSWGEPIIPYVCSCGQVVYGDTSHSHDYDEVGWAASNRGPSVTPLTYRSAAEWAGYECGEEHGPIHQTL